MKLLRYGPKDAEKPGLLDAQGIIRDLSVLIPDIQPPMLSAPSLAALASLDTATLPAVPAGVRLGVPVRGIRKFIGIDKLGTQNQTVAAWTGLKGDRA